MNRLLSHDVEMWVRGFAAGIFFVMTLVLAHIFISDHLRKKRHRAKLTMYGKVWGYLKTERESWEEYEARLREWISDLR